MATGGGGVGGVDGRVLDILRHSWEDRWPPCSPPPPISSPIARTQVRRMLQGPPAVHQQQLRLWCQALQLLLGQVALHSNRLPSSSHPPSRPPSLPHESRRHSPPPPPPRPRRQSRQQDLEGAVQMATAEYVRQGQSAEARAQEEARFR
ncbi:uncharacterized protein LOC142566170 [Dermacentor variabilis]|uniref:uncharacterized protein LOC142566170 n=1 Tax=Dermacentor variabilis TaxID=34621 RepID=UPI003F5C89D0